MSGHSYKACPICNIDTPSVKSISKIVYVGHRRWLPINHPYRMSKKFNGKPKKSTAPRTWTTTEILEQLRRIPRRTPGKHQHYGGQKRKCDPIELNWSKKSIFFELEYCPHQSFKHKLDVMHIEEMYATASCVLF